MKAVEARSLLARSTKRASRAHKDSVIFRLNEAGHFAKMADIPEELKAKLGEARKLASELESKLYALEMAAKALDDETPYELPAGIDPQAKPQEWRKYLHNSENSIVKK